VFLGGPKWSGAIWHAIPNELRGALRDADLSPQEILVVEALYSWLRVGRPPVVKAGFRALGDRAGLKKDAASRAVEKLAGRGLVVVRAGDRDRPSQYDVSPLMDLLERTPPEHVRADAAEDVSRADSTETMPVLEAPEADLDGFEELTAIFPRRSGVKDADGLRRAAAKAWAAVPTVDREQALAAVRKYADYCHGPMGDPARTMGVVRFLGGEWRKWLPKYKTRSSAKSTGTVSKTPNSIASMPSPPATATASRSTSPAPAPTKTAAVPAAPPTPAPMSPEEIRAAAKAAFAGNTVCLGVFCRLVPMLPASLQRENYVTGATRDAHRDCDGVAFPQVQTLAKAAWLLSRSWPELEPLAERLAAERDEKIAAYAAAAEPSRVAAPPPAETVGQVLDKTLVAAGLPKLGTESTPSRPRAAAATPAVPSARTADPSEEEVVDVAVSLTGEKKDAVQRIYDRRGVRARRDAGPGASALGIACRLLVEANQLGLGWKLKTRALERLVEAERAARVPEVPVAEQWNTEPLRAAA
jgi:hypothetical protein